MENVANLPWYRRLHWQILAALVLGTGVGLAGGKEVIPYFGWLGELIIKMLKMVIVPLVFTSIVSGVASIGGGRSLGRMFSKTLGYYVLSSFLAATVGLVVVNVIRPGVGADLTSAESKEIGDLQTPESPKELILDIVPENVIAASAEAKMLAIIFFCIMLGMAIASLGDEHRQPLMTFFNASFQAMMKLTTFVIRLMPIGVFGLIVRMVGETGLASFKALALYMVTIASGLTIHLFVTMPLLLILLGKIKPSIHFRNMAEAMLMAFSTSSSAATLPVTLRSVEQKVGVSNRVSSFVLPMGATVNMDGTALFECVGVLFITQALGIELTIMQQAIVVLTALLASIGAAAVPSAGLVIIFLVLKAVGLGDNAEAAFIVGAMLSIDRPLDMYRTVVNIFGDSCGAAIIAKSEGETDVDTEVRY